MIRPFFRIFQLISLLIPAMLQAQLVTFPIDLHNGQNIETCSGLFVDSGRDTLSPYSNNETFSVTFSTQDEENGTNYISLEFLFFELGTGDILYVHDGMDENADLIIAAQGNALDGEKVWSTGSSLHFRFVSSDSITAMGWLAQIECFQLCDAFYADINTSSGSFDFCPDVQTVSFIANADYYGGEPTGSTDNITYQWNFDGIPKDGQLVTHNYDGPGAYPFRVTITDPANGCALDTIITVRLATIPIFDNTIVSSDTVCSGEAFVLLGNAISIPWTGFPTSMDTIAFITEGRPFVSSLEFDVFPDDQQIVFTDDFDRVCIQIEHVDFGHLAFELECPNGSSVLLKDFGPGGAHLGEPVEFSNEIAGIGYQYCFTTSPQLGTMNETSFQFHTYTDQTGSIYNNQPYLPEANYTSYEPFQNFIGCPLNGTWTIKVEDQITGTSGHVMGWSMYFDDIFYPDSLIFSPQIVEEKWFDQNGNEVGNNPANATINTEGEHRFTFRVQDDFGCQWDTTVTVLVLPLPKGEITSELEIPICEGDSTILTVVADLVGEEFNWLYQWMLEGAELEGRTFDTILANRTATFMVRVTDTITGCADFFSLEVNDKNCDLRIPNVFTPNGDGMNDVFEIENLENYPGSVMVIYNRNGRKVFESNDYYLDWWDGSNQADGTYYYVLTYTRLGIRKQAHGVITIIR